MAGGHVVGVLFGKRNCPISSMTSLLNAARGVVLIRLVSIASWEQEKNAQLLPHLLYEVGGNEKPNLFIEATGNTIYVKSAAIFSRP